MALRRNIQSPLHKNSVQARQSLSTRRGNAIRTLTPELAQRVTADLAALPENDALNGLPRLLYTWLRDADWIKAVLEIPSRERRAWLTEVGATIFDNNLGGYAAHLRQTTEHLDYIWTVEQREDFLRRHTQGLVANAADTLDFRAGRNDELLGQAVIHGAQHLHAALEAGRGVFLLSVHQSHPGFAFLQPGWNSIGVSTVANLGDRSAPHASLLLDGLRDRVELLPTTPAALRPMLHRLASGGCVAVYGDFLYPGTPGIPAPLLGGPVLVASAAVSLALRTGATVLPVSIARQAASQDEHVNEQVEVNFGAPLPLAVLDARDPASAGKAALVFGIAMEAMIRRNPATWRLWPSLRHRWRDARQSLPQDSSTP